jgi:hypothetical protein
MLLSFYLIKGFMVGFEFVNSEDYGKFVVLDLGIVRFYLEYGIED